jgi:plasmid maintenance system antidote protein VapI
VTQADIVRAALLWKGLSVDDLANATGIHARHFQDVLTWDTRLSLQALHMLNVVLGPSDEFWQAVAKLYDPRKGSQHELD